MPRRGLNLQLAVDTSEAEAAVGFMMEMTHQFASKRFTGSVVKYSHSRLSRDFDQKMRLWAQANRPKYQHVYDWGKTGMPKFQLWEHTLKGHGGAREASWNWKPSVLPIPTPMQRRRNPNDPMSNVPMKVVKRLSKPYFFTWKAQVMEYDIPVTIKPRRQGHKLFIPTFDSTRTRRPYIFADKAEVRHPGGDQTTGAFTAAWVHYWSTMAPQSFAEQVETTVEKKLGRGEREMAAAAKSQRSRTKSVGLRVAANNAKAYEAGRQQALAFMNKVSGELDREGYYYD